jgi:arginine exporter protein ArgO
VLSYLALGFAIGVLTGVPIGPLNVAVIDAAYRHNFRRALAVGLGGATADGLYSTLGILGIGPLLEAHPGVPPILYAISGVVLLIYGLVTARAQPLAQAPAGTPPGPPQTGGQHLTAGFLLGIALILLNPSALITWVVIVGSYAAGVNTTDGIACVLGIAVGSFSWFLLVAYLADHGKRMLGAKAIWITRVVGMLIILYGLFSLGRACHYWFVRGT